MIEKFAAQDDRSDLKSLNYPPHPRAVHRDTPPFPTNLRHFKCMRCNTGPTRNNQYSKEAAHCSKQVCVLASAATSRRPTWLSGAPLPWMANDGGRVAGLKLKSRGKCTNHAAVNHTGEVHPLLNKLTQKDQGTHIRAECKWTAGVKMKRMWWNLKQNSHRHKPQRLESRALFSRSVLPQTHPNIVVGHTMNTSLWEK